MAIVAIPMYILFLAILALIVMLGGPLGRRLLVLSLLAGFAWAWCVPFLAPRYGPGEILTTRIMMFPFIVVPAWAALFILANLRRWVRLGLECARNRKRRKGPLPRPQFTFDNSGNSREPRPMNTDNYQAGLAAYRRREFPEAIKHLERAARAGSADAAFYLGEIHNYDTGHYDAAKAFAWYRQAAQDRVTMAMFHVGQALLYANGAPHDVAEGIAWLEKCRELPDAKIRLAQAHKGRFGPSPALDPAKALAYSLEVYETEKSGAEPELLSGGGGMGAVLLGDCYERGIGTEKDERKAEEIYRERADHEYMAAAKLAELFERRGDKKNAVLWYGKVNELAPNNEFASVKIMQLTGSWP